MKINAVRNRSDQAEEHAIRCGAPFRNQLIRYKVAPVTVEDTRTPPESGARRTGLRAVAAVLAVLDETSSTTS
jgi:hypothetical protein